MGIKRHERERPAFPGFGTKEGSTGHRRAYSSIVIASLNVSVNRCSPLLSTSMNDARFRHPRLRSSAISARADLIAT